MTKTKITIKSNSAISVEGEFEIVDETGKAYDLGGKTRVSLCRCGLSQNKPFCDGAHKATGWEDKAEAR
jgi:CDGSH-type Zn-finger protein